MAENEPDPPPAGRKRAALRARAEEALRITSREMSGMPVEDLHALVHELQVHQMELTIQNEELREAQLELAESRDRYASLYDFAPIGYLTVDAEGRITEANLSAATLLGRVREDLVGARITDFVARESQDTYYLHRQTVLGGEVTVTCELEMRRTDGTPLPVRLESVPVETAGSHYCRTAFIDITEKILREEALRELNETLEQRITEQTSEVRLLAEAVSHLGEGVLITTADLDEPGPTIVFVNEAMPRMTGYDAEELIGRSPRILQGPKTSRATLDLLRHRLSIGKSCLVELINYRKDGSPFDCELFITPLNDTSGTPTNFVAIQRDISERLALEQQVVNATEEERERIAHDLHDDLGSLLTGIKLQIEALGIAPTGDRPSTGAIADLVRDAIRKTRDIARGLRPVGSDPEDLINALRGLCARLTSSSSLHCSCDFPEPVLIEDPMVANHLFRIAQEAVTNSLRHGEASRIIVSLAKVKDAIVLTITDDGRGFDYDPRRSRGLGIPIMIYRARAIDGTLRILRREEGGTEVSCHVPVTGQSPPRESQRAGKMEGR